MIFFRKNALPQVSFKKNTILAGLTLLLAASLMQCKKDAIQEQATGGNSTGLLLERTETDPTVVNGMPCFLSFDAFTSFITALKDREATDSLIRIEYTALGVDMTAETVPSLTDNPACLRKELSIGGYTSARKAEETVINTALNNGDDNIFSIVRDPYIKTALNTDHSVKVANRIYKFYPDGGVAIVLNNDWSLYNSIKLLGWESLASSYNLVITHQKSNDYQNYFVINQNGDITSDKKILIPSFQSRVEVDGKIKIVNCSAISSSGNSPTFIWNYADQTTSDGINPNRTISDGEAITVTISNGDGDTQTASPLACSVENFAITQLSNNNFKFGPGFDPANSPYYTKWFFSDGSSQTGVTVTKVFNSNGWVRCEAWRTSNNTKACEFTKNVIVKCGDEKEAAGTITNSNWGGSGKKIKIDAKIWVKNNEIGCKSRHFAKKLGIWWQLNLVYNSNGGCVDINGSYLHGQECASKSKSQEKCLQDGESNGSITLTISDPGPNFADLGKLSSGHRLRFSPGTWYGFGYGGPARLTLN